MGVNFSCPEGYRVSPSGVLYCVAKCPENKQFTPDMVNGYPACVYGPDKQYYVLTNLVLAMQYSTDPRNPTPPPTLESLRTANPDLYNQYVAETRRFNEQIAIQEGKIDKTKRIADAFKALQDAENVRDQSPDAYESARIRYYTLTKGDGWLDEEKQRLARTEAAPVIQDYTNRYTALTTNLHQQERTIDVVKGVKDNVLSIKDDIVFSANAFHKQIADLKNQINVDRVNAAQTPHVETSWIDYFLNLLLVLLLIAAIVLVARKAFRTPQASTPYPRPYP